MNPYLPLHNAFDVAKPQGSAAYPSDCIVPVERSYDPLGASATRTQESALESPGSSSSAPLSSTPSPYRPFDSGSGNLPIGMMPVRTAVTPTKSTPGNEPAPKDCSPASSGTNPVVVSQHSAPSPAHPATDTYTGMPPTSQASGTTAPTGRPARMLTFLPVQTTYTSTPTAANQHGSASAPPPAAASACTAAATTSAAAPIPLLPPPADVAAAAGLMPYDPIGLRPSPSRESLVAQTTHAPTLTLTLQALPPPAAVIPVPVPVPLPVHTSDHPAAAATHPVGVLSVNLPRPAATAAIHEAHTAVLAVSAPAPTAATAALETPPQPFPPSGGEGTLLGAAASSPAASAAVRCTTEPQPRRQGQGQQQAPLEPLFTDQASITAIVSEAVRHREVLQQQHHHHHLQQQHLHQRHHYQHQRVAPLPSVLVAGAHGGGRGPEDLVATPAAGQYAAAEGAAAGAQGPPRHFLPWLQQPQPQTAVQVYPQPGSRPQQAEPHPKAEAEESPQQPLSTVLNEELLRRQVDFLHEMVGGRADVATCRDVLDQVGRDMERATTAILELYSGGGAAAASGAIASSTGSGGTAPDGGAIFLDGAENHSAAGQAAGSELDDGGYPGDASSDAASSGGATAPGEGSAAGAAWAGPVDPWVAAGCAGVMAGGGGDGGAECFPGFDGRPGGAVHGGAALGGPHLDRAGSDVAGLPGGPPGDAPGAPRAAESKLDALGAEELGWDATAVADWEAWQAAEASEALQDKLEELRIYFPHLDDETLRNHLEMLNGNVQEALQLLSEAHEEEVYRRIEMERQAEEDAALARKLEEQQQRQQQQAAGFVANPSAEAYVVNTLQGLEQEARHMGLTSGHGEGAVRAITAPQLHKERRGLERLVVMFGGEVDKELLVEVLRNQGGDVAAARAALISMGLTERQRPPTSEEEKEEEPHQAAGRPGPGAGGGAPSDWDSPDSGLVSTRLGRVLGSGPGSCGSICSGARGAAAAQTFQRPEPFPQQQQQVEILGAARYSNSSRRAPRQAAADPDAIIPADAFDAAASWDGFAAGGGLSGGQQLGPIRLLAALGVDFQAMGMSEEALQCIRVAFENSGMRQLVQKRGPTLELPQDMAELSARHRAGAGRPGFGLTHEEKQALYDAYREVPNTLSGMKDLLRKGAQAAYESKQRTSKQLAMELRRAAAALAEVAKEHHTKASKHIYSHINGALRQQWNTDLHGQLPAEVPALLDGTWRQLSGFGGTVDWRIITGKGLHSRSDGPKLPAIVEDWLADRGLVGLPEPGSVLVQLAPQALARALPGVAAPGARAGRVAAREADGLGL